MVLRVSKLLALFACVILADLGVSYSAIAQTITPGSSSGNFTVTPTGAAQYVIPIAAPPATAGMVPNLSFSYSSQGGDGLMGMGWSLSGLSAISRCPETSVQDSGNPAVYNGLFKVGVQYSASDMYCLDGQRLVAINGTYGADGTEYRTERETFSRIISHGSSGFGPLTFTVYTKSGQIMEYGNTAYNAAIYLGSSSSTPIRVWAQDKVTDTSGNYFTVTYGLDTTSGQYNGQYYAVQINYTGNASASLTPYNSIVFVYDTSGTRPDNYTLYDGGSVLENTVRLTNVLTYNGVYGGSGPAATLVKNYQLSYGASTTTQRSLLGGIQECDSYPITSGSNCVPQTTFTYSAGNSGIFVNPSGAPTFGIASLASSTGTEGFQLGDFNGDGKTDILRYSDDKTKNAIFLSDGDGTFTEASGVNAFGASLNFTDMQLNLSTGTTGIQLGDFNGDGKTDMLVYTLTTFPGLPFAAAIYLSNGDGSFSIPTIGTNLPGISNSAGTRGFQLGDFNGDGRTDVLIFDDTPANNTLYLSNGDGSFTQATAFNLTASTDTLQLSNKTEGIMLGDFNGDGKTDILRYGDSASSNALFLSNGDGSFTPVTGFNITSVMQKSDGSQGCQVGDFNGDGKTDILCWSYPSSPVNTLYLSQGDGTFLQATNFNLSNQPLQLGNTASGYSMGIQLADFNGDGKTDILYWYSSNTFIYLSNGDGSFRTSSSSILPGGLANAANTVRFQLGDFNGDGIADVLYNTDSVGNTLYLSVAAYPDLLNNVTNGLGATTAVNYTPLTNSSVYTKGNGAVYPEIDVQIPLYVVSSLTNSNGLTGGTYTSNYVYGAAISHLWGGGFLGFKQVSSTVSTSTPSVSITTLTDYRQDYPYQGLPTLAEKFIPGGTSANILLDQIFNSWSFVTNPAWSAQYHVPQLTQNEENSYELSGAFISSVLTTTVFDASSNAPISAPYYSIGSTHEGTTLGDVASINVATSDGFSKTTSNTYDHGSSNLNNWFLGRLTQAQVTSSTGGTTSSAPLPIYYNFTPVLSVNTLNYNVRSQAISAGWDGVSMLNATITVNPGVVVGSSSASTYAFDTGSSFPAGSVLSLIISPASGSLSSGIISGIGGASSSDGGPALRAQYALNVVNNGIVQGGGGGGGGSSDAPSDGGGGAGWTPGSGATVSAGGTGGSYECEGGEYIIGGNGGAPGLPGTGAYDTGDTCTPPTYFGIGAGGVAVTGDSYITWSGTGSRVGGVDSTPYTPLTITSVSPNIGSIIGGTAITVTGTGFATGATVTIGGTAATGCTVSGTTSIACTTPAHSAGALNVAVSVAGSNQTLSGGYTYQALAITSVSPSSGSTAGGASITLTGTGFASGATVSIGGVAATGCSVVSATSITCTTPAGTSGAANVVVSLSGTNVTLTGGFTYQTLTLTAISPNLGSTAGGTSVTLTGTDFATGATVTIGGASATGCSVSSVTSITCTTPAGSTGAKDVVVTLGSNNATLTGGFTYSASSYTFTQTISASTANYNLRAAAVAAGWTGTIPLNASITINPGVVVGSSSATTYAFDTGTSFLSGSVLALTISSGGIISGAGGASDANGGPALHAQYALNLTNNGIIQGGGGGGGGSSDAPSYGGGGAGSPPGAGATVSAGGAGTSYECEGGEYIIGGNGGAPGLPGTGAYDTGNTCTVPTYFGSGAGGVAVTGNSYITWSGSGSILGPIDGSSYTPLTITAISPNIGSIVGGTAITLTGTGFATGAAVTIGGAAATGCTVSGTTSITCTTAANSAGAQNVVVRVGSNNQTLSGGFTYQALALTSISPNTGGTAGGLSVTLTGTGFTSSTTVTIGGASATGCTVSGLTSMTCTTPAGSTGAKDVVVTLGSNNATLTGGFTYSASSYTFTQTISSNTTNYNLRAAAVAAGWTGGIPLNATITINSGVYVYSNDSSAYAFDTGSTFPSGSTLTVVNNGYIIGAQGPGGQYDFAGGAGGPALNAQFALTVTNSGTIGGGGGGGAGGASYWDWYDEYTYPGGWGGNGAGGTSLSPGYGSPGQTGTIGSSENGANGGALGSAGSASSDATGGAAGAAVVGNSNITWSATGTRDGALE